MNEQVSLQNLKLCWCVAKNSHLWLASYCKHNSLCIAHCSPMLNLRWSSVDEYTLAVSWRMVQFCSWFLVLNVQDIWMRTVEWSMMRMLSQLLKNLTCLWAPLFRASFQIYSRPESVCWGKFMPFSGNVAWSLFLNHAFWSTWLIVWPFCNYFQDESEEDKLMFFQIPASLPLGQDAAVSRESDQDEMVGSVKEGTRNSSAGVKLEKLPEGHVGKLLVYKSGAVKLKIGDVLFDVRINFEIESYYMSILFCISE